MLTLVERQPRITPVSWKKVMRLCWRARALVATWRALARQRRALHASMTACSPISGSRGRCRWWNARSCSDRSRDRDFCVDPARLDYAQILGRSRLCTLTDAFGS